MKHRDEDGNEQGRKDCKSKLTPVPAKIHALEWQAQSWEVDVDHVEHVQQPARETTEQYQGNDRTKEDVFVIAELVACGMEQAAGNGVSSWPDHGCWHLNIVHLRDPRRNLVKLDHLDKRK